MRPPERVEWTALRAVDCRRKLREVRAVDKLLGRFRVLTVIKRKGTNRSLVIRES